MTATRTINLLGMYLCFAFAGAMLGGMTDFALGWTLAGAISGAATADLLASAVR